MLTKRQLEDMSKNYGTEVLDIDIPGIKAAKTALAYREMLVKAREALIASKVYAKHTSHEVTAQVDRTLAEIEKVLE